MSQGVTVLARNIVRARVPLRLGLGGGGTDLSPYCDKYGGAVLNITLARYAYATIEPAEDDRIHFVALDLEIKEDFPADLSMIARARLRLHAGVARRMAMMFGNGEVAPMRVTTYVDVPPGSGLGSSSALVVALVEAFAARLAAPLGPYDIAQLAYEVERNDLQLPGGKQDQYAATFGGVNFIEFQADNRVIVNPLRVHRGTLNELESSMIVCFTGVSRRSQEIITEQQRRMTSLNESNLESLHQLKHDAVEMKDALLRGDLERMGHILDRSWRAKQRTASGISTSYIEQLYHVAFDNGALGGKVSGAGGGGFMMFIVPPHRRLAVIRALNQVGANASSVNFVSRGAETWTV
jgi:D-glycero-alpha-D-manno-heptose-7-phosphate kinase